jgi:hypothetical protein
MLGRTYHDNCTYFYFIYLFIYFSSVLLHMQHWTCPIMYYKIYSTCTEFQTLAIIQYLSHVVIITITIIHTPTNTIIKYIKIAVCMLFEILNEIILVSNSMLCQPVIHVAKVASNITQSNI